MSDADPIFSAHIVYLDGSAVLRLVGELDLATVPVLRESVDNVVGPHLRALVVDLSDLTFVDVKGLRALFDARQTATAAGAEFELRSPTDWTLEVIRLVGLPGFEDAVENRSGAPVS